MEQLRGSASEYTTDELIELAERESARFKAHFANEAEEDARWEAWWIEHEQWCKEQGVRTVDWRYPDDRERSEPA
ncbi:MAG: hypothetical protein J2P21_20620 [Chloracidobacterium sp.]|nr:hypothetical protein [Chloracidobacterium sp.]